MIILALIALVHVEAVSVPTATLWALGVVEATTDVVIYKYGRYDNDTYWVQKQERSKK